MIHGSSSYLDIYWKLVGWYLQHHHKPHVIRCSSTRGASDFTIVLGIAVSSGYLTVCHGKSPFWRTVNHLFLWAIYTMAMLVITRGYISQLMELKNIPIVMNKKPSRHWGAMLEERICRALGGAGLGGVSHLATLNRYFWLNSLANVHRIFYRETFQDPM